MPILRILLTRIAGNKNMDVEVKESVSVGTNSKINDVRKETLGDMGEVLAVDFGLDTEYDPKIGSINLEGTIYYGGDMNKIAEGSGKKLMLKPETIKEIHQAILRVPIIVAVNTARELGLPMPIGLPRVELSQKGGGNNGAA